MNARSSRRRRLRRLASWAGLVAFGSSSAAAWAQAAPGTEGQVYTLTDEQKAELRDAPRGLSADGALLGDGVPASGRQVHGEVGALVGTGGTRSAFGTAAIPLGQNGGAIVSFESSRFGARPYR